MRSPTVSRSPFAQLLLLCCLSVLLRGALVEQSLSGPGWKLWHDKAARYLDDTLYLPPVALDKLPAPAPSGGWDALRSSQSLAVQVPSTAEAWLQTVSGPAGDIQGVTWWSREVKIPDCAVGKHVRLRFDAVRQRAEVFVNRRLVGYDLIGNTPFEIDLGDRFSPGELIQLDVRITDAGGNFDWRDGSTYPWGKNKVLMSHGFGGITGEVTLLVNEPVHIADVAVLNTPALRDVKVLVEVSNPGESEQVRDLTLSIVDAKSGAEIARVARTGLKLKPHGATTFEIPVSAPDAKLWDIDTPNLYHCVANLAPSGDSGDHFSRRFGFRWFAPDGIGSEATLRLNGRRIVLRTAISWGFWPLTGLVPSAELAERDIRIAKRFGQNMLNFHRCIGQPSVFDKADELGLLIYEEPGNWKGGDHDPLARAMAAEKLHRMVRRDRSHPSLVIYDLINEDGAANPEELAAREHALLAVHAIDPSRVVTRTSGWSKSGIDVKDPMKLHMRPYDAQPYQTGWYDFHHAGGPATWNGDLYRSPSEHYNRTENRSEVVYWGEEGALSTPPRLGMIRDELAGRQFLGWDGAAYLEFYRLFDSFIDRKGLRSAFPTVDALTGALGNVSLDHQGRKIQLMRATDVSDGYAVNGWEAELIENHSGIVDCFRNPKGDPDLLARYNRPLYVAVMPREQIGHAGASTKVDIFVVNESGLKGPHHLTVECRDATGQVLGSAERDVVITGGDSQGQLLAEALDFPFGNTPGFVRVSAHLSDCTGQTRAEGEDRLLCVNWKDAKVPARGAVFGSNPALSGFLRSKLSANAPVYSDSLEQLDWVVAARSPSAGQANPVSEAQLRQPNSKAAGVAVSFFSNKAFTKQTGSRVDKGVELNVTEGATPDPSFPGTDGYNVRWQGELVPALTGAHAFAVAAGGGGVRLTVDGKLLIDGLEVRGRQASDRVLLDLESGKPVSFTLEFSHQKGAGRCRLLWAEPDEHPVDLDRLLTRVRDEGTRLVILDHAGDWMPLLAKYAKIDYKGTFKVGTAWLGGVHFLRAHPLFAGLPVDDAMGWPYQAVVANGHERKVLEIEGEDFAAGAWHSNEEKTPMRLGTVVGEIPCGRGKIIFSTLEVMDQLDKPAGPADVARKLLCNFLQTP